MILFLKKLSCLNIPFIILLIICPTGMFGNTSQKVLITEFMALNSSGLKDEDGDYSDWIELYNPGETSVDLAGWHLTDDIDNPGKWTFPSVSLGAGDYMIIYASDKNRIDISANLHTNFKLSGGGEYLALVEADSNVISYEYEPSFPAQQTDISYGIYLNQHTFFSNPTAGSGNSLGIQVLTPEFSVKHGFYNEPFTVSLSVADVSANIYYTTDGTRPSATTGKHYISPIEITTTTPLSAVCISNGVASPIVSNTYLFIKDIVNQTSAPTGYPTGWGTLQYGLGTYPAGTRAPADYEMDPEVCNNTTYKDVMDYALKSIPTVSIVTNPGYLFSYSVNADTGGIYIYTGDVAKDSYNLSNTKLGADWERPASVEYFNSSDSIGFQINCGLRLHGGNGRKSSNSPKHSFRLSFRSEYGVAKLNYDLFDEKRAATRFDHLVVRAPMNYSWIHNNPVQRSGAQCIVDRFSKILQLDMGQIACHETFIHVYINGLYWGVYTFSEKINNDFIAAYAQGDDSQFDVINDDNAGSIAVDGTITAFNKMMTYANASNYDKLVSEKLLDCTNYIDYMLMNYYIGNTDWDGNNWYTARNRVTPENGFRYFSWDAETCLTDVNFNLVKIVDKTLTKMFSYLSKNADFKLLVADRIQKHFFNGGALTAENTSARYEMLASKIDTAMIAESARWGDYRKDMASDAAAVLYTYKDNWLPRKNYLMTNYFPNRTNIVYQQFKTAGYIPTVSAPEYNTRGGELTNPIDLTISAVKGNIYYTIDGSDPRISGSSIVSPLAYIYANPLHVVGAGTVKARAKSGSEWSAISEVSFQSPDTVNFIESGTGIPVIGGNILTDVYYLNSAIHYTLPSEGHIKLDIYDIDGRPITTLADCYMTSGYHQSIWNRASISKGLFFYKLNFNDKTVTGKFFIP